MLFVIFCYLFKWAEFLNTQSALHYMPTFIHSYNDGRDSHTRCQPAHQEFSCSFTRTHSHSDWLTPLSTSYPLYQLPLIPLYYCESMLNMVTFPRLAYVEILPERQNPGLNASFAKFFLFLFR